MNEIQELLGAVHASGATIRVDGSDLKIKPAGLLTADLMMRLRHHKPKLLAYLSCQSAECDVRDSWKWIEERAAIMEFDGGLSREEANHR